MKYPMTRRLLPLLLISLIVACGGNGADDGRAGPPESPPAPSMSDENVAAMAREHADDEPVASGAAAAPAARVASEDLPYADVEGTLARGYLAAPADASEPLPAVIMIHEWWGLNDNIRAMADRLAAEGYLVLAVDLYGGRIAETAPEARGLMQELLGNQPRAEENLRQAYTFLEETGAPAIAAIGWCLGGHWSLRTALLFPERLDAAVMYYGQVVLDEQVLAPLEVPLLGIFAAEDKGIPVDSVESFRAALDRLDKEFTIEIFPGVGHAFANPSGSNYAPEAAAAAWRLTLDFLQDQLSGSASSPD